MEDSGDNGRAAAAARTVGRAALIIFIGTVVSRLLGYGRFKSIAYYFGQDWETDALFGAFVVPDLVYLLLSGGALTASFIPVFTEYLVAKKEKEAWHVANSVGNLMTLSIAVCVALGILFAPAVVSIFFFGFSDQPETLKLTVALTRIVFPMVIFTALAALCNGILHSVNHFGSPAVAWSLHNVLIISFAIIFHKTLGVSSICFGALAGAATMVLVQAPYVRRSGFRYRPVIDLRHPGVRRVMRNFLPAMLGLAMTQINLLTLLPVFGSLHAEGSVAALTYAVRLLMLPLGLFGTALSMAIFPTLSRQAGGDEKEQFRRTLTMGISMTIVFSLPSTAYLIYMGLPVTKFLFLGNQLTSADCEATAYAVAFIAIGLAGHTAVQVIARGFYALQDTATPFKTGFFSVLLVSVPGCLLLGETRLGHGGVALAVSLSALVNAAALFYLLKSRIPELEVGGMARTFFKSLVATGGLLAVCWVLKAPLEGFRPGLQVLASAAAGGGAFALLAHLLRIEGLEEIAGAFRRRFSGAG